MIAGYPASGLRAVFEMLARADADHSDDGMVALIPRAVDLAPFLVPGGEPLEEMHVTIQYFSDIASIDPTRLIRRLDELSSMTPAIQARVMGHATFNPDGGPDGTMDPCAVYLVSDSKDLEDLSYLIRSEFPSPKAHAPWLAHMTAGYGIDASALRAVGPLVFDRIRLALGDDFQDFPLLT